LAYEKIRTFVRECLLERSDFIRVPVCVKIEPRHGVGVGGGRAREDEDQRRTSVKCT
jgi:hypothetical protein